MRALKTIFIILLVLVAMLVILGLMGPKSFHVERSTVIKAPAEKVYTEIASLKAMQAWSPWKEKDPNAKITMEGTDGAVGSSMSWDGNDQMGSGKQTITELAPNKSVNTALDFIKPFEAHDQASLDLEAMGDSTKITWGMQGDNNFMARVMCVFMSLDKMVGPDFEHGLGKLKTLVEAEEGKDAAECEAMMKMYGFAIADHPTTLYAGVRDNVKWDDMHAFFAKNLPLTFAAVGKAKVKAIEPPVGVFFKWDTVNKTADMLAGVAIPADAKGKVQGVTEYEAPASKAYSMAYTGPYSGEGKAHDAMAMKMKMDKVSMNECVIEEYVTDPMTEKDSTKWVTNIIYLVK